MGYTTDFDGGWEVTPNLASEHVAYLKAFNATRRMGRRPEETEKLDDPVRVAAGLGVGDEGAFFVGNVDSDALFRGMDTTPDVIDQNTPPSIQPGLWCGWTAQVAATGESEIIWDGGEKFYGYVAWIEYLLDAFLIPWGYVLNGEVTWEGEDPDDRGRILIENNLVTIEDGHVVYVPR